jgi:TIR domain
MSKTREPHAFISYVREDAEAVDELEKVLMTAGIPIWRDVRSLFPGDVWKAKIKEAIQEDALAFIPVFSKTSEARHKSQMREEIRLAIDEYRKMAPYQPWIFSVRLDEVDVPKYEISANQNLTDLNWTNFFGPTKTVEATLLVTRAQQLLGESNLVVASASTVASSGSDAARGSMLSSAIREGITDLGRAADATQLVIEEARRVTEALNDETRFPLERPEGSLTKAGLERTKNLTSLVGPLVEASVELGARGKMEDTALATQLVNSLAREGFASRGGIDRLIQLRKLPSVCVLTGGAFGATARKNGPMLAAFVAEPDLEIYGRRMPVTSVLSPWDPFGPEWELPQFIIATLEGGQVTDDVLAAYDSGRVRQMRATPASDIIHLVLQSSGRQFAIGEPEFDDLFQRTEVLIAAITNDWCLQHAQQAFGAENWIGGHPKNERYTEDTLPKRMLAELEAAGEGWWPLTGGLFARSYERAHAAMTGYVTMADEARKRRFYP